MHLNKAKSRDKAYAEILVSEMHPDLFPADSLSPEAKQLAFRFSRMDMLDDLKRVHAHDDIPLASYDSPGKTVWYVTEYEYSSGQSVIKVEETQRELAKFMRTFKSLGARIEKDYSDSYFHIHGHFPSGLKVTATASRETVCERVVTGKKLVPATASHYEDEVEWKCEKVALYNL